MGSQFGTLVSIDFAVQFVGWLISAKLKTEKYFDLTGRRDNSDAFIRIRSSSSRLIDIYFVNISESKQKPSNTSPKYTKFMRLDLGSAVRLDDRKSLR